MKQQIVCKKKKSDAIMPVFGFSCALLMLIICGIFDVRKLGVETSPAMYWIVRILCLLLIPAFVFLLARFIRILFKGEVLLNISEEGIYTNIHKKALNICYEDIEDITWKDYPNGQYVIFLFLKEPSKYLWEEQLELNRKAKEKIPQAGDVAIPSIFIPATKEETIALIQSYIPK